MEKAISVLSGGLDSAVSTAIARNDHHLTLAITYNYGQKSALREIEAATYLCKRWSIEHKVIDLDTIFEINKNPLTSEVAEIPRINVADLNNSSIMTSSAKVVWIPNRNGIFINIAAGVAEVKKIPTIIVGFNREEAATFPDNSREFIEQTNECLKYSTLTHPQVISYVQDMDKTEILRAALELEIDIGRLWCCYDGGDRWCGRCESCARTIRAMKRLKLSERHSFLWNT